ncbi:hypothetical protein RN001_009446 [Aquatica leii]|uniref:Uncharacterized protein n=1 Tax=Aquatica leii TaxID=1421715 RepID=A0AAN7NZM2_9COLE|nr:hypothetical protein RN001_009446 [Aquatica leii]
MLGFSALIGIYFGCFGSKQNSAREYLLAGQTMKVFPVAMSLISSNISGVTIMAAPADIYKYGANYIWSLISILLTSLACVYIYMPVFLKLQLVSTYEYLEMRFDKKIRTLASTLFTLQVLLFNPIIIYLPALAFSHVTGLSVHIIAPTVCLICIFYTTIGGLKAVVWTDTLQTSSIFICLLVVFGLGISMAGGFLNIIKESYDGHRLDVLDFDLDPTRRDGFWAFIIGCTVSWIVDISINQSTIQRLMAVPTINDAKKVVFLFCIGTITIKAFTTFAGIMMYAKYSKCDPISSGQVTHSDQILPYFVMEVGGQIPGLPGLFIAGIFSGALSSLSTTLNTLSATFYSDFLSKCMPPTITEKEKSNIFKLIVIVAGILCTTLVFVVEKLGGIFELTVSFSGITAGSLVGLFTLGALWGGIAGLLFNSWLVLGNQWYKHKGLLKDSQKPFSVENCTMFVNTTLNFVDEVKEEPFVMYRITFWYYTFFGTIVVLVVGLVISYFTRTSEHHVNPDLLSPVIKCLLPKQKESIANTNADFNLKNPTKRDGFWAFIIGCTVTWILDISINQGAMQRLMAVPTISDAKKVVFLFCVGTITLKAVAAFVGVMMYAKYSKCDPISSGLVSHSDQIVPYFVMDVGAQIPGLPGVFIAGIFSGALSTLSTTLNTLSATFYSDFVSKWVSPTITEKQKSNVLKITVIVIGIFCTMLIFLVEKLGGIFELTMCFRGITAGSLVGIFTLGILFPSANAKGALWGGIAGLLFSAWLVLGKQWYKHKGLLKDTQKPFSVENCTIFVNTTLYNVSGITIMAVPADVYRYGANYVWTGISVLLTGLGCIYIYMPVFLKLRLVSIYEYLEMRFDRKIRSLASVLFTIQMLLFNPIIIYLPALAFLHVTGLSVHVVAPIVCTICIFYTTIGGLKAVLWTDTLQAVCIFVCLLVVFGLGVSMTGGFVNIINKSYDGHRLDVLDFDLDPTKRNSFWAIVIGTTLYAMVDVTINQSTMQRLIAMPKINDFKKAIFLLCTGTIIVRALSIFTGIMIYAKYSECDPILSKQVTRSDQMLPYFVMDVGRQIPGLPGMFMAGIFSGALSTLSTTLNTLSATIYSDFISKWTPPTITEKEKSNILKIIVIVAGTFCTALVFVLEQLDGIMELVLSFGGITSGSLVGIFTLGVFGLLFNSWIILGNLWYKHKGVLKDTQKPFSVENCTMLVNTTLYFVDEVTEQPFVMYRITFWYYTLFGTIVVLVVGLIISFFTRASDHHVNSDLLSPVIKCLLPKQKEVQSTQTPLLL